MGALGAGGALDAGGARTAGAAGDDSGGAGDAEVERVGAAISGERATGAPVVVEVAWDVLGVERGASHDCLWDLTQTLGDATFVQNTRHIKAKHVLSSTTSNTITQLL